MTNISHNKLPTDWPVPPCQAACPVNTDARRYVALIAQERYKEALDVIMATNPLPSVIGRICAHPCESACRRAQVDEPIAICHLKRFVADKLGYSDGEIKVESVEKTTGKSIGIIGAGPSGLTAASDLARRGHAVTIYEKHPLPGGMLRYGILDYRLPPDVLDSDINNILALGIELKTGIEIGSTISFKQVATDHDAIIIAVGLSVGRSIPLPGVDLDGVHSCVPILEAVNEGRQIDLGSDIIVIGGGNVAVDTARSLRRFGERTVKMVCLEAKDEMPAHDWEIADAIAEGVEIHCSWGPDSIVGEHGRVKGLEFKEATCVFDNDGRFNPQFNESNRHILTADTVVMAVGQGSDLSFLKGSGVRLTERGLLDFDRATMQTSEPTVFATGEVVTGPGAAISAMAGGHRAAAAVEAHLTGEAPVFQEELTPVESLPSWMASQIWETPRRWMPRIPEEERLQDFSEVELGYTELDALRESQRCLSCTAGATVDDAKCAGCLTCVRVCPYGVPEIQGDKAYMDPSTCQSCGFCASECPADAISVKLTGEHLLELQTGIDALEAGWSPSSGPATVGFVCQFGHAWGADAAFDAVSKLPEHVRVVRVLCPARLAPLDILRAFEDGAERVFLTVCGKDYCHYKSGNGLAERRLAYVRTLLDGVGIGGDKLVSYQITQETSLARIIEEQL